MRYYLALLLVALALAGLIGLTSAGCGSGAATETGSGSGSSSGTASGSGSGSSTRSATSTRSASSPGITTGGAETKLTARDKAVKFAECIRAHGVSDFPDPDSKNQFDYGVSVTPAVWKQATTACKDLQPPGTLSGKRTPKEQSAGLRFAQCVRDHGVKDFPGPVNGEPLIDTYKIPSSNRPGGMTILNAATRKCGKVLKLAAGGQG